MIDSTSEIRSMKQKCSSHSPEKLKSTCLLPENKNNSNGGNNLKQKNRNSADLDVAGGSSGSSGGIDLENIEYDGLIYKDEKNFSNTMHMMNVLRKNRQLCDLILQLDDDSQDIYCHQIILACNSKFFMEIFNKYEMEHSMLNQADISQDSNDDVSSTASTTPTTTTTTTTAAVTNSNTSKSINSEKKKQWQPLQEIVNKNHNSTNKQLLFCLSDYLRNFLSDHYQHHHAKINSVTNHNCQYHHYHHYHSNNLNNHHIDGAITNNDEKSHQINQSLDYEALKICIDYMYTSKLKVPSHLLPHVYTLAYHLSFEKIVQACGQYLIKHLNVDNCLSIRSFALDENLIQASSQLIEKDIEYILQLSPNPSGTLKTSSSSASLNSLTNLNNGNGKTVLNQQQNEILTNNNEHNNNTVKFSSSSSLSSSLNLANIEFNHLPRVNIELVGLARSNPKTKIIENIDELNGLCMSWLTDELIHRKSSKLMELCDNLNMLYMNNMDHTLHDCCDMNSSDCNFNDYIDDYQKKHNYLLQSNNTTAINNGDNNSNSSSNNNNLTSKSSNSKNGSRSSPSSNNSLALTNNTIASSSASSYSARLKTFKITDQELNAIGTATPIKLKVLHDNEIICTHQTGENSFITICTLTGKLVSLSVHILSSSNNDTNGTNTENTNNNSEEAKHEYMNGGLRDSNLINSINENKNKNTDQSNLNGQISLNSQDSTTSEVFNSTDQQQYNDFNRKLSSNSNGDLALTTTTTSAPERLPKMSSARCSHGLIAYDNKLYIIGGYDRGECLDLCEIYDPVKNMLVKFDSMENRRGRAPVTWVESQTSIYCFGGSNGFEDLNSIEYYDMIKEKWSQIKFDFDLGCTNLGAIACDKYVYLVGLKDQSNKMTSRSSCLRYEPTTNTFNRIASLNNARSQSALVWISTTLIKSESKRDDHLLFVFGGHDQIKCLNSCEVYSVKDDKWTIMPNMLEPRRGCGAAVHQDSHSIYIVGGTNGSQSLRSVEIYDIKAKKWTLGPELHVPRANVAIAFIGDILFAVGGFDGKSFLKTIEYLNCKSLSDGWSKLYKSNDFEFLNKEIQQTISE